MQVGIKLLGRCFEVEGLLFIAESLRVRVGITGTHGIDEDDINISSFYLPSSANINMNSYSFFILLLWFGPLDLQIPTEQPRTRQQHDSIGSAENLVSNGYTSVQKLTITLVYLKGIIDERNFEIFDKNMEHWLTIAVLASSTPKTN